MGETTMSVSKSDLFLKGMVWLIYGIAAMFVAMVLMVSYVFWDIPIFGPALSIGMIGLLFFWVDKVKYPPKADEWTWQEARERLSKPYITSPGSFEDLMPEPLWEAGCMSSKTKVCLVCAGDNATSVLRTVQAEIVPMCKSCSCDWNFYGYSILKRVKPKELPKRVLKFKLRHWFATQSIFACYRDLQKFAAWGKKMKRFAKDKD